MFGMSVGAVSGHYWHRWLDRAILPDRPKSLVAVAQKVALDQGLFSPLMLTVFLLYVQLLEGRPDFSLVYLQVSGQQPTPAALERAAAYGTRPAGFAQRLKRCRP